MSDNLIIYWVFPDGFPGQKVCVMLQDGWANGWYSEKADDRDEVHIETADEILGESLSVKAACEKIRENAQCYVSARYRSVDFILGTKGPDNSVMAFPCLSLSVAPTQFDYRSDMRGSKSECREKVRTLTEIVRDISNKVEAVYAFGRLGGIQPEDQVPSDEQLRNGTVDSLDWVTVFPESTVDTIGRTRILQAPAWHVEELDSGQILLVVTDNPRAPSDEWEDAFERTREHLGLSQ